MKQIFSIFLLIVSLFTSAQNIFKYEKEINNPELYDFEEIDFQNLDAQIKLSGTLIKPKLDFDKIVIIVPGSEKDTRHSHYILAEQLLKENIAVYRFDERGVGKSEGKHSELAADLSNDLNFAFKDLQKKYSSKKIGIIGHSLGGIATLKIIEKKCNPDFIVFIETPIAKNGAFVLNQIKMNYENSLPQVMREGKTKEEILSFLEGYFQIIRNNNNSLEKEIKKYIKEKGFNKRFIALLNDPFLMEMVTINLEETLKNTNIKSLFLTGTLDKIINHEDEITTVKSFQNPNIEIKVFEDLNHYLTDRKGVVGSSLYQMDQEPLKVIINWILKK
ncbi:alpha/beta fold hydrolase [Flavobacterium channae]|uniref:alpha/beta fold hydrolase n=1 Tax=Flavobacterium channae TaxID=2897181 RepID=UPI001E5BE94C|nr:alpha/beta fold hydrolase [Flavobacterium channae]UGS24495.1 lysophospholipase [Flavobacterium channae]